MNHDEDYEVIESRVLSIYDSIKRLKESYLESQRKLSEAENGCREYFQEIDLNKDKDRQSMTESEMDLALNGISAEPRKKRKKKRLRSSEKKRRSSVRKKSKRKVKKVHRATSQVRKLKVVKSAPVMNFVEPISVPSTTYSVAETSLISDYSNPSSTRKKRKLNRSHSVASVRSQARSIASTASARSLRSSRSRKSISTRKTDSKVVILPTKKLIKLLHQKRIKFSNDDKVIPYFQSGKRVKITDDQLQVLKEEHRKLSIKEKAFRMQAAKERASKLNQFAARFRESIMKNEKDVKKQGPVTYMHHKIQACAKGWVVRWKLKHLRDKTVLIQRWWTKLIPQLRFWKQYYSNVLQERKTKDLVDLVEWQFRGYHAVVITYWEICRRQVTMIQSLFRTYHEQQNFFSQLNSVTNAQIGMRKVLVCEVYEKELLNKKLSLLKLKILQRYEELFAPYSRRALFCYSTRKNSKHSYTLALKEYTVIVKNKSEEFMTRKTYHLHLQFVYGQLMKHVNNPNFVKICRGIFEEDCQREIDSNKRIFSKIMLKLKPKKKRPIYELDESNDFLKSTSEMQPYTNAKKQLPMHELLLQMTPSLFDDNYGVTRANWGALLCYTFVINRLLTPKTSFVNDIPLKLLIENDVNKIHAKIPYKVP